MSNVKRLKNKNRNLKEELVSYIVFRKMFDKILSRESSDFGRLLLQENLISNEIIVLLFRIDEYILLNLLKSRNKTVINIVKNRKVLEGYTLGKLIEILELFLSEKSYPFIKRLKIYKKKRNKLTHKIFSGKYKDISDLFTDARIATKISDRILKDIKNLQDNIF